MRALVLLAVLLAAGEGGPAERLQQLAHSRAVAGETICMASPLQTFYARRQWRPAWDAGNFAALTRAIDGAASHGLDPQRYHARALAAANDEAARDVLATDAFLRLASNLARGAVDPQFIRPAWCAEAPIDLAAVLQSALENGNVEETIERLAPSDPRYQRLRAELRSLRGANWAMLEEGRALRFGDRGARVVSLRERLGLTAAGDVFDDTLKAAVIAFQAHHGLAADGIVGKETRRELNITAAERAQQIAVNLERWRWMPRTLGTTYVIVNIAGFQLTVVDRGAEAMSMRVIVGKLYHETPFFAARITDVTINPWWNVPDSIAAEELWPKQRRQPGYFGREHLVVTNDGRIRQTPGPWNSLGRVKFEMANRYDVYLHDTPAKSLFDADVRAFSHGCIRIERPLDLAAFLLRDQPRWTTDAISASIVAGAEAHVALTSPVPVYVLYWTAWPAADGDVEFHRDVYGVDERVRRVMSNEQ